MARYFINHDNTEAFFMVDTIKLKEALGNATHVLPYRDVGMARGGRWAHAWRIIRGRSAIWFGRKDKWGDEAFPAQDVRDLISETEKIVNSLRHQMGKASDEREQFEALVQILNSRLPEDERVIRHAGPASVSKATGASGGGGSGGSGAIMITLGAIGLPLGYSWPNKGASAPEEPSPIKAPVTDIERLHGRIEEVTAEIEKMRESFVARLEEIGIPRPKASKPFDPPPPGWKRFETCAHAQRSDPGVLHYCRWKETHINVLWDCQHCPGWTERDILKQPPKA